MAKLFPFDISITTTAFASGQNDNGGVEISVNGVSRVKLYRGDKGLKGDPGKDGLCNSPDTACCVPKGTNSCITQPLWVDGVMITGSWCGGWCILDATDCPYRGKCDVSTYTPIPLSPPRTPDPEDSEPPPAPPSPPEVFPPSPVQPPN